MARTSHQLLCYCAIDYSVLESESLDVYVSISWNPCCSFDRVWGCLGFVLEWFEVSCRVCTCARPCSVQYTCVMEVMRSAGESEVPRHSSKVECCGD